MLVGILMMRSFMDQLLKSRPYPLDANVSSSWRRNPVKHANVWFNQPFPPFIMVYPLLCMYSGQLTGWTHSYNIIICSRFPSARLEAQDPFRTSLTTKKILCQNIKQQLNLRWYNCLLVWMPESRDDQEPKSKRLKRNHADQHSFTLKHGSLLVMRGYTQRDWMHSVPKRTKVEATRINLTFRYVSDGF